MTEPVQMVIDLQAVAGIKETREDALKIWESFSEEDKQTTIDMHMLLFGNKDG